LRRSSSLVLLLTVALVSACGTPAKPASTVAVAGSAVSARCRLPELQELPESHPRCLFFRGTQSFRDQRYASAFANWQAIVDLGDVPVELERYKSGAYNNLGFLYFMGWGVDRDRNRAVNYWKLATKLGDAESEYHLCHAYGDSAEPSYNPSVALGYCKEALRRYTESKERTGNDEKIVEQLNRYIARLEAK